MCIRDRIKSDFWCNVKFSSSFTTEYKEIWKENLVIYQKSLKAILQATLQMLIQMLKRVIYPLIYWVTLWLLSIWSMHPFTFGISAHVSTDFWVLIEKPVNRAYGKFTRCRVQNTFYDEKYCRKKNWTVKLDTTVLSATCHAAVWMWLGVSQNLWHCVWQAALKKNQGLWNRSK